MSSKTAAVKTENISEFLDDQIGLQVASIALLALAMIPIYTGSFCSLRTSLKSTSPLASSGRRKSARTIRVTNAFEDTDDEDDEEKTQVLTVKDAFLFPIIASGVVYAVYLIFQEIQPHYIHEAIQLIASLFSCAVFSNTALLVAKIKLPSEITSTIEKYKFKISNRDRKIYHVNVTYIHVLVLITSVVLAVTYALTQHWIIGNLFAICVAINAIGAFTVDSFGTGFLLLLGMLAYDVFWLFGTNVMLNVSNLLAHAPTSIMWPRNINTYVFHKLLKSDQYFTMFGLGDIIVPGMFIAYCLRFDKLNSLRSQAKKRKHTNFGDLNDFPKPYFIAAMIAYALSAGASIYIVHFTKKAQSALLFIVPALILTTLITATVRGELWAIYNYNSMLKTINKLSNFSADENEGEEEVYNHRVLDTFAKLDEYEDSEEDDERPVRFQKAASTRGGGRSVSRGRGGRSTSVKRDATSTTETAKRGGRGASRGSTRGRSKSTTTSRSTSKPRATKKTVEKVVIEEISAPKKRRSTSRAAAKKKNVE